MTRRRVLAGLLAAATVLAVAGAAPGLGASGTGAKASDTIATDSVTVQKPVDRTEVLADGTVKTIDSRTVGLTVEHTTGLFADQRLTVSWTGAQPTAGFYPQVNDPLTAPGQEYPMVLLQCNGTDTQADPITPQDCFTASQDDRGIVENPGTSPVNAPWIDDRYSDASLRSSTQWPQPFPKAADCPIILGNEATSFHDILSSQPAYILPYVDSTGNSYPECSNGSTPPEATGDSLTGDVIPNETFARTGADGTGSAQFQVRSADQNASLDCAVGTASCSIVAVPIEGLSCDLSPAYQAATGMSAAAFGALTKNCIGTQNQAVGQILQGTPSPSDYSLTGELWFAASNWRNRISVPISFADDGATCGVSGTASSTNLYGSELFTDAGEQWRPAFCADPNALHFTHVAVGEPQADGIFAAGNATGILTTFPPASPPSIPSVSAPVAETGFAISYVLDTSDPNTGAYTGQYVNMKLNPRLLAKLLTQSYSGGAIDHGSDPTANPKVPADVVATNPANLLNDPEFRALNPGAPTRDDFETSSTLIALNSQSDVMKALTSYITADPDARAFLDGTKDPWGMQVNPAFQGVTMPQTLWSLADSWLRPAKDWGGTADPAFCPQLTQTSYLSLLAAPVSRLSTITADLLQQRSAVNTACNDTNQQDVNGQEIFLPGRPSTDRTGLRVVIGITSLADAERFEFPTAQLQTYVAPNAATKFTDASNRVFVGPTIDTLQVAADASTEGTNGFWELPYSSIHNNAALAEAYPGTMAVTLTAPTSGLSAADAAGMAGFFNFAAAQGQTSGTGIGQLPQGYLPITAEKGLGAWSSEAASAAKLVAAQQGGDIATPTTASSSTPSSSSTSVAPTASPSVAATPVAAAGAATGATTPTVVQAPVPAGASASLPTSAAPAASPQVANVEGTQNVAAVGKTPKLSSVLAGAVIPVLLGIILAGSATGVVLTRRRIGPGGPR